MKEITAIIRMNKVQSTKKALSEAGFPSLTVQRVLGRGRQKGLAQEFSPALPEPAGVEACDKAPLFIAKRMLTVFVDDESAAEVVRTVIDVNQTGHYGDGKVFVSPVIDVVRVRTKERGVKALF